MKLHEKIPVNCEGKDFEIRVLYDDTTINVVAFHNNHPANGFRHQIKFPKKLECEEIVKRDAVKDMIELSKKEITENKWEKFMESLHEN